MDAIDVNWCLNCACHIDGTAAYCSRECLSAHTNPIHMHSQPIPIPSKPSSSSYSYRLPRQPPPRSVTVSVDEEEQDDDLDFFDQVPQRSPKPFVPCQPSKSAWIGKGVAGIPIWAQDVIPGPPEETEPRPVSRSRSSPSTPTSSLRPKLLQGRRPTPTVYMSKTEPAPPVPSMPICTPQQRLTPLTHSSHPSLPTTSSQSMTNASLTSLTTGISTSIATPASEDPENLPSAETHKPNFIGTLTAHLASWACSSPASSKVLHQHNNKDKSLRSKTVTRRPQPAPSTSYASRASQISRPQQQQQRRAYSPIPFFVFDVPAPSMKEKCSSGWGEKTDEHPAFKTRGRKPNRL
ncbi:hypothetical protein QCA50_017513 [Cerrena zonata]|uniref:Uncharacterized protein n=1 Tax=Cerrena zonata TaxID=2478898 RepID=A0AAW0FKL9_9APHY